MNKHSLSYDEKLRKRLENQEYARLFLEAALQETRADGDREAFLLALREVVDARGGVPFVAQKMDIPKQSLYKTLSKRGNPRLNTLDKILTSLGLRLSIESLEQT